MDIIQHMGSKVKTERLKVGVLGSTGYTGAKLVELLLLRNDISLEFLGSQQYAGQQFSSVYPNINTDLKCEEIDENFLNNLDKKKLDFIFFATPNGIAYKSAPSLQKKGFDVIDLSADYRFRDLSVYEKFYNFKRDDKEDNAKAIYGLVEFNSERIKKAAKEGAVIIGNPGCYTTSSILALTPVLKACSKIIDKDSIIVDGKSGISGAGRKVATEIIYAETNESCSPYNLGGKHRHTPELEAFYSDILGSPIKIDFSPHLIPMTQGLLTTNYVKFKEKTSEAELREIYKTAYKDSQTVKILEPGVYPKTLWAMNTNQAFIQINYNSETMRATFTCAIDNLVKGAAGQAIQNMDLILEARI